MAEQLIGAVEAGGTKFILALARADGTILSRARIANAGAAGTWPAMVDFFRQASAQHGPIAQFGIASFGPIVIDPDAPDFATFTTTPKPGWRGERFQDPLAEFGAPIALDTDVNGAALAEFGHGAGKDLDRAKGTLVYTTVGTGIGTGVVKGGKPVIGFTHYESGHLLLPHDRAKDPFPGWCKVHGDCSEGLASGSAIMARWGKSLDQLGQPEIELVAGYLGALASTLVLLHMPDRLVFGGGVMNTPGLIEAVRAATDDALKHYVESPWIDPGYHRYVVTPALGDDAGITGAVMIGQAALAAKGG